MNQFRKNAFNPIHPMSVPAAQRSDAMVAKDKAKSKRILSKHGLTQAALVEKKMGSAGIPTVAELEARKTAKRSVPTVAEYNERKYGSK